MPFFAGQRDRSHSLGQLRIAGCRERQIQAAVRGVVLSGLGQDEKLLESGGIGVQSDDVEHHALVVGRALVGELERTRSSTSGLTPRSHTSQRRRNGRTPILSRASGEVAHRFVVNDRDKSALEEMGAVQRLLQHRERCLVSDISDADVTKHQHWKRTGGATPSNRMGTSCGNRSMVTGSLAAKRQPRHEMNKSPPRHALSDIPARPRSWL